MPKFLFYDPKTYLNQKPVRIALGVGDSPSPTILWVLAFQCQSSTVQS